MNIIIVLVAIALIYFVYKLHSYAAKFDRTICAKTKLRDYENEYFLKREEERIILFVPYLSEHGCLPNEIKKVSISEMAKNILFYKVYEQASEVLAKEEINARYMEMDEYHITKAYFHCSDIIRKTIDLLYE